MLTGVESVIVGMVEAKLNTKVSEAIEALLAENIKALIVV
jgi:hypothetical protein